MRVLLFLLTAVCVFASQVIDEPGPKLEAPAAGAREVALPVVFEWAPVKFANAYQIQVAGTDTFESPLLVDETVEQPRFRTGELPSRPLWWRVRGLTAAGRQGAWSETRRFEPRPRPPAVPVFAVTLTPAYATGGDRLDGLVTLARPAPAGGASVNLASSNGAAATVPERVTVPAGASSAPFDVNTRPVSGRVELQVTASAAGTSRAATLTLMPPPPPAVLLSLSVNPATMTGGRVAQGTVRLSEAAPPPRGATVRLSADDNSLVMAPQTVTVPVGQRMASFPIKTGRPGVSRVVTLTASLGGVAKSAGLRLEGAGSLFGLPAPEPQSPAERQAIRSRAVLFRWGSVPGAASYTVQVDGSGGFSGTVFVNYTLPDLETRIAPFTPRMYWWRVRANDSKGAPGEWSEPRAFHVE